MTVAKPSAIDQPLFDITELILEKNPTNVENAVKLSARAQLS